CVGCDGRLTSPALESALVAGLMDCGLEVWRIGVGPTPMLYFAVLTLAAAGGGMVTGSHNPPGPKRVQLVLGKTRLFRRALQELGRIAAGGTYAEDATGVVRDRTVFDSYVERLAAGPNDGGRGGRALSVAWDAGNGAAGQAMAALTRRLPGRHILLNETI